MFPRYGVHPGASPTVCFAAPPLDVCGFAAWRYAPTPGWTPSLGLPKGLKIKSQIKSQSQSQSRSKDRSLRQLLQGIGCFQLEIGRLSGRHRWQASSHSGIGVFSQKLVSCQAAIAGKPAPTKVTADRTRFSPLNTMSVSSSTALDLRARRQAEWRDLSGGGSAATVWRSQTQREEVQRSKP